MDLPVPDIPGFLDQVVGGGVRATLRLITRTDEPHDRALAVAIYAAGLPLTEAYRMTQRGELRLSDEAHSLLVTAREQLGDVASDLNRHLGHHDS